MKESPIFVKSFEATLWLLEHTAKFPKHKRFVMAKRIEDAALSFQDELVLATKVDDPVEHLRWADYHLERLRLYSRLCLKLKLSSFEQYEHMARSFEELGKLLGGWLRARGAGRRGARDSAAAP